MAIDWTRVKALAPELSDVAAEAQTEILDMVARQATASKWGSQAAADNAGVWLARHLGYIFLKRGGGSPALASVSAGPVSKSFATSGDSAPLSEQALRQTMYGLEYLRLCQGNPNFRFRLLS